MTSQPGKRALRVLFVVNVSWFFVSHRLPVAIEAKRRGFDVHIAATPDGGLDAIREGGLEFHAIQVRRSGFNVIAELRLFLSLLRLYKSLKPQIVHHVTSKPIILGSLAARLCGVPGIVNAVPGLGVVFSARGRWSDARRRLVILLYRLSLPRRAAKFIFQNRSDMDLFVSHDLVKRADAVLIRGSGVDLEQFRFVLPSNAVSTVVLASRMLKTKGVPEFVAAASELKRRGETANFLLVGGLDTENPDHISERQLREWDKQGVVKWLGHRTDVSAILEEADIVCLPTTYGEGVPKVLIEAAACGRPIVATDVPGCREIVRHGYNGLLIPPRDIRSLIAALRELLNDRERRMMFGTNSRRLAETGFAVGDVVEATLAVYGTLPAAAK